MLGSSIFLVFLISPRTCFAAKLRTDKNYDQKTIKNDLIRLNLSFIVAKQLPISGLTSIAKVDAFNGMKV